MTFFKCTQTFESTITTTPGQLPELSLDLFISRELEQLNSLSFKASPLFEHKAGFYASPAYLEKYGEPTAMEELTDHNILIWGERPQREVKLNNGKRIRIIGQSRNNKP